MSKPDIATILDLAEKAYHLGIDEHDDARKNSREFSGATPKRKHPAWRIFDRVTKKHRLHMTRPGCFGLKIIAAAYDQGLVDRQVELDAPYIRGELDDDDSSSQQHPTQ